MQFELIVRDIAIDADIGVYPYEIGKPQRLVVHARLGIAAPEDDALESTVDYAIIEARAIALGRQHIGLIEIFARRLAQACLDDIRVTDVEIVVEKPGALRNGVAATRITARQAEAAALAMA